MDANKIVTSLVVAAIVGSVTVASSWAITKYKVQDLEMRVTDSENKVSKIETRVDTIAIINCKWAIQNKVQDAEKLCFKILER